MKFALVSHILPPSFSGQAMILYKILKDVDPSNYCLLSIGEYNKIKITNEYSPKLSGKYYTLPKFFPRILIINKGINKLKRIFKISPFLDFRVYLRSNQIIRILKKDEVDSIVACTGDLIDMPAAYMASKKLKIPFYAYIFDYYSHQWTIPKERAFAREYEEIIIKGSAGVIVPNEFMREELKNIYGVNSTIVYNCNELTSIQNNALPWPLDKNEIKIVYTGAIYGAHYDAFQNLAKAINSISTQNINLHLYTNQSKEWLAKKGIQGKVIRHDYVELSKSIEIQKKADILFLPLAFNTDFPEVINTSMPGKMGEYLASGRPILVHAPKDSFVSWYFKKNNCGLVVDTEEILELGKAIHEIINNKELRKNTVQKALRCAFNDFNIDKAKKNFFTTINYKE